MLMRFRRLCFATLLAAVAAAAANPTLELRGLIDPPTRAMVGLYGSTHPFQHHTLSDSKGRFRFKNLPEGTYPISVFDPRRGESRRTVEVTKSFATEKGRIEVTIPFQPSKDERDRTALRSNTVNARELSVSPKASNLMQKARNKLGESQSAAAVGDLQEAVRISPQFVDAWNLLGTISYQRGEYDQAEKYFRSALEHDDDAFEPTVNLGGTLLSMGRHEEAFRYNQFAVLDRPESALANSQMGMNHFFLGDQQKALDYLNKAKRLDPSHFSNPQLVLAEIYVAQGRLEEAIIELEDILKRHPDSEMAERIPESIERLKAGSATTGFSAR